MIIWGTYDQERHAGNGAFVCPQCSVQSGYQLFRTYRVSHIYGIPIGKAILSERLICESCQAPLPISVLASSAPTIGSALDAGQKGSDGVSANLGNVVTLTPAAAAEIQRRHAAGGFTTDDVARIMPGKSREAPYIVVFDYILGDGRDWIGQSQGIPIVVSRHDAPALCGRTVDYREGKFCDPPGTA